MNRADKEAYKRDYAQAKKEGKPFFPYAIYKDHIVAVFVFAAIIGMAIWQRVDVGPPVYTATSTFEPRPEWYFFFLFQMLKIFKNQNALMPVIMATFVIPNILMVLLIATPFIDRSPERRISRRPFALSVAILVFIGMAYLTDSGFAGAGSTATGPVTFTGISPGSAAAAGQTVFETAGCTACHMVKGQGGSVGPNLTDFGTLNKTYSGTIQSISAAPGAPNVDSLGNDVPANQKWVILHTICPKCLDGAGAQMPPFDAFTPQQYLELATFISGLGTNYK